MTDPTFTPAPAGRGPMSPAGPNAIVARAKAYMPTILIFDGIADDDVIPLDKGTGLLLAPYVELQFGTPIRMAQGRSLAGPRAQPYQMTFTADCWAATASEARDLGFGVMDLYLGFTPEEGNTEQIEGFGGGDFRRVDVNGRPIRFCQRRQFSYGTGMASVD